MKKHAMGVMACAVALIFQPKRAAAFFAPLAPSTPIGRAAAVYTAQSTAFDVSTRHALRQAPSTRSGTAASAAATGSPDASEEALDLQQKLRKLCANKAEPDREARIEKMAQELNVLNPTKDPALSPLLAGRWQMLYSTVPGPSSGRLGPFVGNVFQEIRPAEGRIVNILELGPSWALKGALEADVEVVDGDNWAIVFDFVRNTFAGIQVQEKIFDRTSTERRIWNMTYLDEGFRVLYGRQEGLPAEEGFIFVMERA